MKALKAIAILLIVSGLQAQPREVERVGHFWNGVEAIWYSGDYLYISTGPNGLQVYNYADPANPRLENHFRLSANLYRPLDDTTMFAFSSPGSIGFYDLSNPDSPDRIGSIHVPYPNIFCYSRDFIYTYSEWVVHHEVDYTIFQTEERLIDITNRSRPRQTWERSGDRMGWWSGYSAQTYENRLYRFGVVDTAEWNGAFIGIEVLDISDPNSPQAIFYRAFDAEVNSFSLSPDGQLLAVLPSILNCNENDTVEFLSEISRIESSRPRWVGWYDNDLMMAVNDTLSIWSFDNPASPERTTALPANGVRYAIQKDEQLTLIENRGIVTYEIDDDQYHELSVLNNAGQVTHLAHDDDLLLAACGSAGLKFYDASDPLHLRELGSWTWIAAVQAVAVDSNLAIVYHDNPYYADSTFISIVDISDIANPVIRSTVQAMRGLSEAIVFQDGYLYIPFGNGAQIFDCRNPDDVELDTTFYTNQFSCTREKLFIQDQNLVRVYNISIPSQRHLLTSFEIELGDLYLSDFAVVGDRLHLNHVDVTNPSEDIYVYHQIYQLYDISDIEHPSLRGELDLDYGQNRLPYQFLKITENQAIIYEPTTMRLLVIQVAWGEPGVVTSVVLNESINYVMLTEDSRYALFAQGSSIGVYDFVDYLDISTPDENPAPANFEIYSAFPNPFNSSTTITFTVQQASQPVRLTIYDLQGRLVADLLDRQGRLSYGAGEHKVVWDAAGLPSAIYFLRLESGNSSLSQKVILMR